MRSVFSCCSKLFAFVLVCFALALTSCHKGHGGGSGSGDGVDEEIQPLTPDEQAEADKDPSNVNVPPTVVPGSYQGKVLYYVEMDTTATLCSATRHSQLTFHFKLKQGGTVTGGRVSYTSTDGQEVTRTYSGGSWEGWSPNGDTQTISRLYISATDGSDGDFSLCAERVALSSKSIQGDRTYYTGEITGGTCTIGDGQVFQFPDMDTDVKLIYYTATE